MYFFAKYNILKKFGIYIIILLYGDYSMYDKLNYKQLRNKFGP